MRILLVEDHPYAADGRLTKPFAPYQRLASSAAEPLSPVGDNDPVAMLLKSVQLSGFGCI